MKSLTTRFLLKKGEEPKATNSVVVREIVGNAFQIVRDNCRFRNSILGGALE